MKTPLLSRLPRLLLGIMLVGLAVRVLFVLVGIQAYYHSAGPFVLNGDSASYMLSFENLWHTGWYTFDKWVPDASFGRLPGYPFFYGLHYLIAGPGVAAAATAWSQVLLDTASIWLVFQILAGMRSGAWAPYVGALLYATYPFVIVWNPVIGTETLSTDLTLLWLYGVLRWRPTAAFALAVGALLAINLFVRAYMGALIPITVLWVLLQQGHLGRRVALRRAGLVALGFALLYLAWPVRNYALSGRVVLLKPVAAGYINQTPDVDEFYQWVHCWDANENPWLDSILVGRGPVHFPAKAFATPAEAARGQALVALARRCGSGYYALRGSGPADSLYRRYRSANCNEAISSGFRQLRTQFATRRPLAYWLDVPLQNLRKAFFKSALVPGQALHPRPAPRAGGAVALLFGYRTVLLLLGWGGALARVRRTRAMGLVLAVSSFQYFYICFLYRGLEMRYLLQADVLLLLPAALLLGQWAARAGRTVRRAAPGPALCTSLS